MGTNKLKILAVDDEPRNLKILLLTLGSEWEVHTASSGEEALKFLETEVPDMILLDIMMPGTDGYEVCKRVRANPKFALTKVILVSGKAMIEERLRGYEIGADDYLPKPFVPEEMQAKVRVFMRLTVAERELLQMNTVLETRVAERTRQLLEAEAKLVSAAKMSALGEMAGGIAHEINTPLGAISLLSEQIQDLTCDEAFDKEVVREMASLIEETASRASQIIQGLKMFSRQIPNETYVAKSLKYIVENTMHFCEAKLRNHDFKLEIEPPPENLVVDANPVQISQVLVNLLNNSFDALENQSNRWIRIGFEFDANNQIVISVTDSGLRLPANVRAQIFQPFFTTKELGKGTGLGLSISKGLMESNRGQILYDETSPNVRFLLKLPCKPAQQGAA